MATLTHTITINGFPLEFLHDPSKFTLEALALLPDELLTPYDVPMHYKMAVAFHVQELRNHDGMTWLEYSAMIDDMERENGHLVYDLEEEYQAAIAGTMERS